MNIVRQFSIKSPYTPPSRAYSGNSRGKAVKAGLQVLSLPFKAPLTTATFVTLGFAYSEYQEYKKKMENKLEPVTDVLERLGLKKPKVTEESPIEKTINTVKSTLNSFDCTQIEPIVEKTSSYIAKKILEAEQKIAPPQIESPSSNSESKSIYKAITQFTKTAHARILHELNLIKKDLEDELRTSNNKTKPTKDK